MKPAVFAASGANRNLLQRYGPIQTVCALVVAAWLVASAADLPATKAPRKTSCQRDPEPQRAPKPTQRRTLRRSSPTLRAELGQVSRQRTGRSSGMAGANRTAFVPARTLTPFWPPSCAARIGNHYRSPAVRGRTSGPATSSIGHTVIEAELAVPHIGNASFFCPRVRRRNDLEAPPKTTTRTAADSHGNSSLGAFISPDTGTQLAPEHLPEDCAAGFVRSSDPTGNFCNPLCGRARCNQLCKPRDARLGLR